MTKTLLKLRSKRGETLVEMLVSIVILGLSISIMTGMIAAAYSMNKAAREESDRYYNELSAAEMQGDDDYIGKGTVSISDGTNTVHIDIDIFGGDGENSLRSYSRSGSLR